MDSNKQTVIRKLYEAVYPYAEFHNDYQRACSDIKAELKRLRQHRSNKTLLMVMAKLTGIKITMNDTIDSLHDKLVAAIDVNCSNQEKSLYERLGGIFPIALVVNRFSDALISNPLTGIQSPNPQLREWSRHERDTRLPGLKWLRTLWVCDITGGPYRFQPSAYTKLVGLSDVEKLNLEKQHCPFKIEPKIFDEVASELDKALGYYQVPSKEKKEVLDAFASHKGEVTACSGFL